METNARTTDIFFIFYNRAEFPMQTDARKKPDNHNMVIAGDNAWVQTPQQKYWVKIETASEKVEPILRRFLLKKANSLRLTKSRFAPEGWEQQMARSLKSVLYKKIASHKRYPGAKKPFLPFWKPTFTHYFFKVRPKIKKMVNEETLLCDWPTSKNFFGFEYPLFYKGKEIIGFIEEGGPEVILSLTYKEIIELKKEGIQFGEKNFPKKQGSN